MSAERKLARCIDDAVVGRTTFPDADCARPALAAVVPEKVRGLSMAVTPDVALTERERTRAAPALAGLCLGFIPAARPLDATGRRPLPSTVELDAEETVRLRSPAFLVSAMLWALIVALVEPVVAAVVPLVSEGGVARELGFCCVSMAASRVSSVRWERET